MKKTLLLASCCLIGLNGVANASTLAANNAVAAEVLAAQTVSSAANLEIHPFVLEPGQEKVISIYLNDSNIDSSVDFKIGFNSLSFNLLLPEGVSIKTDEWDELSIVNGDRAHAKIVIASRKQSKDNSYNIVAYDGSQNHNRPFDRRKSGDILKVTLVASPNMSGAVSEVQLRNVVLASSDETVLPSSQPQDMTISLVSGAPVEENVVLQGNMDDQSFTEVSAALSKSNASSVDLTNATLPQNSTVTTANPNSVIYVAEGQQLANTKNVVVGGTCENLELTDGNAFAPAKPFVANVATYTRSIGKSTRAAQSGWYSVCLPYAAEIPANAVVEQYVSFDGASQTVFFEEVQQMEAGKPYIFQASEDVTFTATGVEVVDKVVNSAMVGTFSDIAAGQITGKFALRADGTGFGVCANDAFVPAFRAYLDVEGANLSSIKLNHGEATGIEGVEAAEVAGDVYTLGGQLVKKNAKNLNGLAKGVYVVNGKKVVK